MEIREKLKVQLIQNRLMRTYGEVELFEEVVMKKTM